MSEAVNVDGELHLVVAWAQGRGYQARVVAATQAVKDALRSYAGATVAGLKDATSYAPDADMEDDSHMVSPRDESIDTALVQELSRGGSLDLATEYELWTKTLTCHALVITTGDRTSLFVRKRSPIQLAKKSLVARLLDDRLDQLVSPLFAFDARYDAIFTEELVYIIDKKSFEGLFKDSPAVLAKTNEWVNEVAQFVPFTPDSVEHLQDVLKRNSVLRNKFLAVKGRSYLQTITVDMLREEMERQGMDPEEFLEDGCLKVTGQNVKHVLRLLNEDLFQGGFSKAPYAASTKRML